MLNILLNIMFKRIEPEAVVLIEGSLLTKYTNIHAHQYTRQRKMHSNYGSCEHPTNAHWDHQRSRKPSHKISPLWRAALVYHHHIAAGSELSTSTPVSKRSFHEKSEKEQISSITGNYPRWVTSSALIWLKNLVIYEMSKNVKTCLTCT